MVLVRANPGRSFRAVRTEVEAEGEAALRPLPPSAKRHRLAELQATLAGFGKSGGPHSVPARARPRTGDAIPFGLDEIDACFAKSGLARGAVHEVMPASTCDRASGVAFATALLARAMTESDGPAMLVTSDASRRDFGTLYGPGLFRFGIDPSRLVVVEARSDLDALWAIEEVLRSHAGLAGALALMGKSVSLVGRGSTSLKDTHLADLTVSRRLTLAAAESATPLFLEMPGRSSLGSAAMTRWRIAPAPAPDLRFGPARDALFRRTRWRAHLERSRNGRTGEWTVEWDHAAYRFHMAAELAGDTLAQRAREREARSTRLISFRTRAS